MSILKQDNNFFLPLKINIFFTNFCNYRCDYCFLNENNSLNQNEMSKEIIEHIIFYMKKYKVPLVSIYGGDPLLSKNILYMIEKLSSNKNYVVIATNAIELSEKYLRELKSAGLKYLQIGIDRISNKKSFNYKEESHINKVLESIKKLKNIGIKYGVASCLTRENKSELKELIKFCKENKSELLKVSFYNGTNKRFILSNDEKEIILKEIKEYNKKNNNYIKSSLLEETLNFTSQYPNLVININGDILIEDKNLILGNIKNEDIGKIYSKYIKEKKND